MSKFSKPGNHRRKSEVDVAGGNVNQLIHNVFQFVLGQGQEKSTRKKRREHTKQSKRASNAA